ncbi:MAG TPA: AAA family ATPase [Stellaceae bacterium]|jgi:class 3 adenylate cyclase/tetratricopeptide (TPR) repeat protein|nr:AAA family ATPase [Stellaceae bacterium]
MPIDVAVWLRRLGLQQYAPAFAEHDIDPDILPQLTAEDLSGLGVASIGHRRRLLAAIAALRSEAAPAAEPARDTADLAAGSPLPNPPPLTGEEKVGGEAERRQLTVMFCDLVGSTPLSTRFDPEDLREIVGAYHRCVAETIAPFAGFVAKYMGDGVLVYFGWPEAHEDDAERAVRAGLAVIDAVGRLATPESLNVRIGVATGLVVVGDLIGAGAAQERGVVGETPNLAARLQGLARPGTLVVADGTRRQIGTLFEVEDLGPQPLAGFAEPQPVWRAVGESGVVSRFEALRSPAAPMVGRDEELELLLRRWEQAKAGEGRVVLVSGEAGLGKSRLTAAMAERVEAEPHTRLRWFSSPHHQDSALYPTIVRLERAAGFARDDPPDEKLAKLSALLAPGAASADELALIAELLSLPSRAAELNLSPQRKRELLFEALLRQLAALARANPVLAIFEDAHWIDPTSRELLDLMVDRVRHLPVVLVITFRPEFEAPWGGQPHVANLSLNRLGGRDASALVLGLAGNTPLGSEVVAEIVERTDGVPLFVEELTKAVIERGEQGRQVGAVLSASPLPALAVPPTLQASLTARLDRIGSTAREVAQIGAVLGREFSYELIEQVAQRRSAELENSLSRLTEAGLLFCRGVAPNSSYLFKHALVQDAAYGTLLRARRQELHARVAAVLEADFSDLVERQPELLAHHLTGAAQTERAVAQWLAAGQFAAARLAPREAIGHFDRGLFLLGSLPQGASRDAQEVELQLARGLSLFFTEGFISAAAARSYARARELAERCRDGRQLIVAIYGQWQVAYGSGDVAAASPISKKLLALTAAATTDSGLRLQAHHSAWTTSLIGGEPVPGREHCAAGRRLYDIEAHRSHRLLFGGHDPGVCARMVSGHIEWVLGFPDTALAAARAATELAEQLHHPLSLELAMFYEAMLHLERHEPELALQELAASELLAAEQRLAFHHSPEMARGGALLLQGELRDALAVLRAGLQTPAGRGVSRPYGLVSLAHAMALSGEPAAALGLIDEAMGMMEAVGHRQYEPEFYRIKGIALREQNDVAGSEAAFAEALRSARRRQMKAYELRAATSLARLWGEEGRREEARELLAPVYGWFTEGFDTADLKEAKALLEELAA